MKHVYPLSKPAAAQEGGARLNLLVLLISPLLALYSVVGQVIRLVNPGYQKDFIGPDQAQ